MTNNPKNRQQWIFDLLKVEQLTFGECFSKYYAMFSKSEVTFSKDWNKANGDYIEYQNKVNKAKEDISIAIEVEAHKSGLKSKFDRMLDLTTLLVTGVYEESVLDFKTGKVIRYHRKLNAMEIRGLHAELSKMAGEYAPTKIASTDPEGNAVPNPFITLPNGAKIDLG